ncbi:MAG: beta-ACP synthase, partial [Tabrizicola sp.]|nr:beta-ACP synthase [Tabrizicola sp.]
DAGMAAGDVGYVNAHGTGTAANDRSECAALRLAFGAQADRLLVSSTKAMHGHAIGATGAIEILACLSALSESCVPPTIGFQVPDPECDLDIVANTAREAEVASCLSNAFAFGGLNAVLALRRAQ